jgi:DNA-directed RNA polymerase
MTTLDSLTKSFDNLFMTTIQNMLRTNIEVCKWSFLFTSVGVGINLLINSFYLVKISNENNILKSKINLLLNETKLISESNITIYEIIRSNSFKLDSVVKNIKSEKDNDSIDDDIDYYMPC